MTEKLPGLERGHFGVMTYDHGVHFYNIVASRTRPQMYVVNGSPADMFVPLHDGCLTHIRDHKEAIINLLGLLPSYWAQQTSSAANLNAALTAAKLLIRHNGGRVSRCIHTLMHSHTHTHTHTVADFVVIGDDSVVPGAWVESGSAASQGCVSEPSRGRSRRIEAELCILPIDGHFSCSVPDLS